MGDYINENEFSSGSEEEKQIDPVLENTKKPGLDLRPITGNVLRQAKQLGFNIDRVGLCANEGYDIPADEFYDQLLKSWWLLADDEESILFAIAEDNVPFVLERWRDQALPTLQHEQAVVKAFIARWIDFREGGGSEDGESE